MRPIARIKGLGFIFWHTRHEFYHVLLGLVWAWFLRERWSEFNPRWIWLSVFGSLLPDSDHLAYFLGYGRHEGYSKQVKELLKNRQWRMVTVFMESGHKYNTSLASHNVYFMAILLAGALVFSLYEVRVGVILLGAMLIHYVFDITDDLIQLGAINPNWKRWGRRK